jgi:RNA 2',3'-cyclic 3'-phosphodiesterase
MRLFFALWPDGETRKRMAAAAQGLKLDAESALVPPENLHLTLAFIGEVPASQVAALLNIGGSQCAHAFSVRFDQYEYWPRANAVVAAARETPASLEQLWQQIHADLAQHNLALVHQRLRPHITIARKVSQAPVLQAMSAFTWAVDAFSLMHSNTAGARPSYTVVDTWPLLDECATT